MLIPLLRNFYEPGQDTKFCLIKNFLPVSKMKVLYICDYLHNSGKFCGKACIRLKGCRHHWNVKSVILVLIVANLQLLLVVDVLSILGDINNNKLRDKAQRLDLLNTSNKT